MTKALDPRSSEDGGFSRRPVSDSRIIVNAPAVLSLADAVVTAAVSAAVYPRCPTHERTGWYPGVPRVSLWDTLGTPWYRPVHSWVVHLRVHRRRDGGGDHVVRWGSGLLVRACWRADGQPVLPAGRLTAAGAGRPVRPASVLTRG